MFYRKKNLFCLSIFLFFALVSYADPKIGKEVISTRRIVFENYPGSFNPSIFKINEGFLLCFRYIPDLIYEPWISYIGVALFNESWQQISEPQLLNTRQSNQKIPSQSEDARIFAYKNKLYLIFNDNTEVYYPTLWDRRDMYTAELIYKNGKFDISKPLKLIHSEKYRERLWQKNWCPFVWENTLLITYTINPHEIVYPNFNNGNCYSCYQTSASFPWDYGELRGSSPSQLVDGEYLSFFHSAKFTSSQASDNQDMWHYYMGVYTFSPDPPFEMTKITPVPIVAEGFYTDSYYEKRVVLPGGFIVSDSKIYVAYGKDDCEIWIATNDKEKLKQSLVPVTTQK